MFMAYQTYPTVHHTHPVSPLFIYIQINAVNFLSTKLSHIFMDPLLILFSCHVYFFSWEIPIYFSR